MSEARHDGVRIIALLLLAALTAGCAAGVGARRISARDADQRLAANVLATGEPSAASLQVLHRHGLLDLYREDRVEALIRLHATLAEPDLQLGRFRARLFALSELAFDHARRESERILVRGRRERAQPWFLASAVYAFGFVSRHAERVEEEIFDSRSRLAADLYNRALSEGLDEDGNVRVADGVYALPFGSLSLDFDESKLRWGSFLLTDFVATAGFETRGIANRYRHAGAGAALAAGVVPDPDASGASGPSAERIGPRTRVPSTLLMFLDFSREALVAGDLHGRLELYTADVGREITINDRVLPLEVDSTAALALQLDDFDTYAVSRRAFLFGDLSAMGPDRAADQLGMLAPYRRGRVPVVFVHGTYSDPSTWVEMLNELSNDPILSDKLQFWFFFYGSGAPLGYSGGLLAHALRAIVEDLDPQASDPALQQMVVIGHSQGGLLTKLSVVDSGLRFWDGIFEGPPDELGVSDETREILTRSLVFEPVQPVSRVVFISTPHGGSFLTRNRLTGLINRLISIPAGLQDRIGELLERDPDEVALGRLGELPTSLDNMRPGDPFLETLHELSVVDGVDVHSIVGVRGEGPDEKRSDGVVRYMSAHISQGTELLVHSGHAAHRNPEAIGEVRRILREHLGSGRLRPRENPIPPVDR